MKRLFGFATVAAAALIAGSISARAATLNGDTVTVQLSSGLAGSQGVQTRVIGDGAEGNYYGNQFYDFDDVTDTFSITSTGSFCGMTSCGTGDTVIWSLTSLDFGGPLTSVSILRSIGGAIIRSFSADSVVVQWTEAAIPQGTYFAMQFRTDPASVPLPASLPLLVAGLAGVKRSRASA